MFYTRPKLPTRIHRKLSRFTGLRPAIRFAAGLHAANGLAHGVQAPDASLARP
jgi:hypothetical protein